MLDADSPASDKSQALLKQEEDKFWLLDVADNSLQAKPLGIKICSIKKICSKRREGKCTNKQESSCLQMNKRCRKEMYNCCCIHCSGLLLHKSHSWRFQFIGILLLVPLPSDADVSTSMLLPHWVSREEIHGCCLGRCVAIKLMEREKQTLYLNFILREEFVPEITAILLGEWVFGNTFFPLPLNASTANGQTSC